MSLAPAFRRRSASRRRALGAILALLLAGQAAAQGVLPGRVRSFTPGVGAGFGQAQLPDNVLTGPDGGQNPPYIPNASPGDLLSLGDGGQIVLEWTGWEIFDGPGPDFIVFENVLRDYVRGDEFVEAATVEVSGDGVNFVKFPPDFIPPEGFDEANPAAVAFRAPDYAHLAGTLPTLATRANGIDPADPSLAGGNAFDLADIQRSAVRFIRLRDIGRPGTPTETLDKDGQKIYDDRIRQETTSETSEGFDFDTIVAIHARPFLAKARAWTLYK